MQRHQDTNRGASQAFAILKMEETGQEENISAERDSATHLRRILSRESVMGFRPNASLLELLLFTDRVLCN